MMTVMTVRGHIWLFVFFPFKVKTDRQGVDRDREHETHNHFLGWAFPIIYCRRNGVGGLLQAHKARALKGTRWVGGG